LLFKKIAVLLSSSSLLIAATTLTADCAAMAKGRKSGASRGAYFVPPPPPYQPSILPEMGGTGATTTVAYAPQPKIQKPYSKYIYTRNAADAPTVVQQPNRYVTYWSKAQ
jgi:hypothetical protein